jgi:hypothetical protein
MQTIALDISVEKSDFAVRQSDAQKTESVRMAVRNREGEGMNNTKGKVMRIKQLIGLGIAIAAVMSGSISWGSVLADYEFNDLTDSASTYDLAKAPWNSTVTVTNGQAVFDGSGFYYTGNSSDLIQSQSFTGEALFSINQTGMRHGLLAEEAWNQKGWSLYVGANNGITLSLAKDSTASRYYNLSIGGVSSNLIESGKSYYVAAVVDTSRVADDKTAIVTFYLQNLTDGGEMQTFTVTDTYNQQTTIYNATNVGLSVGGNWYQSNSYMNGSIDRVRLSAGALSQDRLLKN